MSWEKESTACFVVLKLSLAVGRVPGAVADKRSGEAASAASLVPDAGGAEVKVWVPNVRAEAEDWAIEADDLVGKDASFRAEVLALSPSTELLPDAGGAEAEFWSMSKMAGNQCKRKRGAN